MALGLTQVLAPDPLILVAAVLADLVFGDPVYRLHPIRLVGGSLASIERLLRRAGADGYAGGIILFVILSLVWVGGLSAIVYFIGTLNVVGAWIVHAFLLYSLLALGDLLRHVWRVEAALARSDLDDARAAISHLVGRDTDRMDAAACRRAAIESLSENLADGFTSPVIWYAVGGLPLLVLFKVVSTMDSMVGFKTPRYLRFGWCGARMDDVMNYVPARLTWLTIAIVASVLPSCSARKAFVVGLEQHAVLPGPNSGWSEAAAAGGIQRKLVGPVWLNGQLVTDIWLGDPSDPPARDRADLVRAMTLVTAAGIAVVAVAAVLVSLS